MTLENEEFNIGRFSFHPTTFNAHFTVFRNDATGGTVALANAGNHFNDEGLFDTEPLLGSGWISQRRDDEDCYIGTPFTPWGYALREEVRLPRTHWRQAVGLNDHTLAIHIPRGGGMTPDVCRNTFQQAVAFFATHSPDHNLKAIHCYSWIASPLLARVLPRDANLLDLHAETYLYPVWSKYHHGLNHIFGHLPIDPATAPRDTSLQRVIADYLQQGYPWHIGGFFILLEDVQHYGTRWYRTHWQATLESLRNV